MKNRNICFRDYVKNNYHQTCVLKNAVRNDFQEHQDEVKSLKKEKTYKQRGYLTDVKYIIFTGSDITHTIIHILFIWH